jgi:Na+/proline symporter/signal transduction histidine kinase/CheY-like chemotaxis protein
MISQPLLLLLALSYVLVLVLVALWAERHPEWHNRLHPYIYSLTLAVYCSSWTYFGAVGTAARGAWAYLPIYLGPILLFVLGTPLLKKLVRTGVRQKTTSLADFIGSRYGKRQALAALVAVVAVVGSMPYIALQLKAVSLAWDTLAGIQGIEQIGGYHPDSALITAVLLAVFSMVFGTRHLEGRERNRGMMAALSVESLVKLLALIVIAVLALVIATGIDTAEMIPGEILLGPWLVNPVDARFITTGLLAMLAIICLPRQFHVTVVEFQDDRDLKIAPWLFPLYLLIISAVVLPITLVGQQLFDGSGIAPDTYVLNLSMLGGSGYLTALAFIGGFSAATGMVIVAAVTLSIMISNEIVLPLLLRWKKEQFRQAAFLGKYLRWIRRGSILVLLVASWALNRMIVKDQGLASLGLVSFACFAQLAPALIGGIYWRRAHALGVYAGLAVGFLFWWYCLLFPALLSPDDVLLVNGPWGVDWLRPQALFGLDFLDPLSHGVWLSLCSNVLLYIGVSLLVKARERDKFQADIFVIAPEFEAYGEDDFELSSIQVGQLRQLLESFISRTQYEVLWRTCESRYRQRLLDNDRAPVFVVRKVEQSLAAIVGAASAHSAVELLGKTEPLRFSDIAAIVGGTSEQLQFSQGLLQATVETITQGICVVDAELNVMAWNQRYEQMFDYPPRLLYVGCPIDAIYRFNAERGMYRDSDSLEHQVGRRLELLRSGGSHRFERILPNGTVIQVVGNPMPNGGFVSTFTDISDYKAVVTALEEAKATLEDRVEQRTADLSKVNLALEDENRLRASAEAEVRDMHTSKSRFMQAASHDLLQPISAAKLFVAAMQQQLAESKENGLSNQVGYVEKSLETAEQLISALREIARLDSGKMKPNRQSMNIGGLLQDLATEFNVLAIDKGINLHFIPCHIWVKSDPQLLRCILQNFLSNAIHYTKRGRLILGCRRKTEGLRIEVWDTGPGISPNAMDLIFQEFERLNPGVTSANKGLGLGLTIAKRMADLLGHKIHVKSEPGEGSVFSILVPYGEEVEVASVDVGRVAIRPELKGVRVLCIDNEEDILQGMKSLLNQWGCQVLLAKGQKEVLALLNDQLPDILLVDFHLDEHLTGLEVVNSLPERWRNLPCILISADNSDEMKLNAEKSGFLFLSKPITPENLSEKMSRILGD